MTVFTKNRRQNRIFKDDFFQKPSLKENRFLFLFTLLAPLCLRSLIFTSKVLDWESTEEKPYKGWTSLSDPKATCGGGRKKTPKGRKTQTRGEEITRQGTPGAAWPCHQVLQHQQCRHPRPRHRQEPLEKLLFPSSLNHSQPQRYSFFFLFFSHLTFTHLCIASRAQIWVQAYQFVDGRTISPGFVF